MFTYNLTKKYKAKSSPSLSSSAVTYIEMLLRHCPLLRGLSNTLYTLSVLDMAKWYFTKYLEAHKTNREIHRGKHAQFRKPIHSEFLTVTRPVILKHHKYICMN